MTLETATGVFSLCSQTKGAGMVSDLDILRCAALMIRQHRGEASIFAIQRVHALTSKGDLEGRRVWLRIVAAITGLQEGEPAEEQRVH